LGFFGGVFFVFCFFFFVKPKAQICFRKAAGLAARLVLAQAMGQAPQSRTGEWRHPMPPSPSPARSRVGGCGVAAIARPCWPRGGFRLLRWQRVPGQPVQLCGVCLGVLCCIGAAASCSLSLENGGGKSDVASLHGCYNNFDFSRK